jgi:hypothetical protein
MKLEKTIKLLSVEHDCPDLRKGGRDLGHELPRKDFVKLRKFREEVASLSNIDFKTYNEPQDFVLGYRQALLDVAAAYEDATITDWIKRIYNFRFGNENISS